MAGFGRRKAYELPSTYGRSLAAWGESLLGDTNQAQAVRRVTSDLSVLDYAQADPAGFLDAMAALVKIHGGSAAVGANEMIHQVLSIDVDRDSRYAIIDAALTFLHERGVPWKQLKPYMQERWIACHGSGIW